MEVKKKMETSNVYSTGKVKCRKDRNELRPEMEEEKENERER